MNKNIMKTIATCAFVLVIIGALNWLLIGLFQWDLIAVLFGGMAGVFSRILYALIGIAGLLLIYTMLAPKFMKKSTSVTE